VKYHSAIPVERLPRSVRTNEEALLLSETFLCSSSVQSFWSHLQFCLFLRRSVQNDYSFRID